MPDDPQKESDTESTSEPVVEPVAEETMPAEPVKIEASVELEPVPEVTAEPPVEAVELQTEVSAEAPAEAEENSPTETPPNEPISPETAQRENEPFSPPIEAETPVAEEQLQAAPEPEIPAAPAPAVEQPVAEQVPTPQAPVPPFATFTTRAREMLVKARTAIQDRKRTKLDKILVLLDDKKNIANDDVEKLLHVSDATATRYLNQLEREGKIIQVGKTGQAVRYVRSS